MSVVPIPTLPKIAALRVELIYKLDVKLVPPMPTPPKKILDWDELF